MICESTQELIPQGMFVSCVIQVKKTTKNACSDFWNEFGKKTEGDMTDSRERTADTLYNDLESVALTIEGTNPNVTEDGKVHTTEFIQDTKKRQLELVTRSGLQRLRCDVCHLLQKQTMTAPTAVQQFFKTVLQQVHHFKVDVITGDVNTTACRNYKKQVFQDLYNSSVVVMLREMQREVNTGRSFESRPHIDYYAKIIFLSFAQQVISIITTWLFSHEEGHLDPELWEHSGAIRVSERRITRNVRPENFDNPMIVPEDFDVRQSGRVLELQNRDLWIRQTDLSWHFPILVTIRECPSRIIVEGHPRSWRPERTRSKKSRSRRLKKKKRRLEFSQMEQTWTWTTASSSSSSAWREWSSDQTREYSDWQSPADWKSSDQTRERSDWQSADSDSSDQAREATIWQSKNTWHWGHLHRSSQEHPWRRK